jgi:predicted phosphodiesterase
MRSKRATSNPNLRILVLSDLHAYTPNHKIIQPPSFLLNSLAHAHEFPNPIVSIPKVLGSEQLEVDWILCPGDIADKADPDAQAFAWAQLEQLRVNIGARLLLGTAGNHDIDSRLKIDGFDPKGRLLSLRPSFPGLDRSTVDKYWARNFHIHTEGKVRLLNLNSAAFHGYHSDQHLEPAKSEYRHGRVSAATIESILASVNAEEYPINILLTHHHPYKLEHIYANDYSEMVLGGKLIHDLTTATKTSWLVIHGHQHYPQIYYGQGTVHPPVIFSAGSVSAVLSSPLASEAANQFYHITIEPDPEKTSGWAPCGFVRAWHWHMRSRWDRSPYGFNIPFETGFGCRASPPDVAKELSHFVRQSAQPVVELRACFQELPHLQYLVKDAMEEVMKLLPAHGVKITPASTISESNLRILPER